MYVVAGVTGRTGRVVAETLLEQKQPVRVIVREESKGAPWRALGAEVAVASLDDSVALTRALTGAAGAYLLVPPQYGSADMLRDQAVVIAALAAAVKASGIPHAVLLSSLGADHVGGTGPVRALHRLEREIEKVSTGVTHLRAAYFVENIGAVLGEVQKHAVYPTFLAAGKPIPMVASADIGRAAAALLLDPSSGVRVVDLFGPVDYTQEDIARVLGELSGREVKLAVAPLEAVVPALTASGMSPNVAELFREMFGALNSGLMAPTGPPAIVRRGTLEPAEVLGAMLQPATA